ncbi:MAG: flagellar motor switch protein FliN [Candidatus Hydrogenedentes bacterium]|nr:flagellar motor switch protein FliN [Candidatus Hydrogenedentota bacterium]MBI3118855.1 flagellar motor switch protein FliN [Candidatus Hydrogenedentota bacterium]
MNENAAAMVAQGLLEGASSTLQAMTGEPVQCQLVRTELVAGDALQKICGEFPLALTASLPNGVGGVAMLLTESAALQLVALLQETTPGPGTGIGDAERALLKDLAEAVLGGAVARLLENLGQDFGQLEQTSLLEGADAAAGLLAQMLKPNPTLARFEFRGTNKLSGAAALLSSQSFEDLAPAGTVAKPGASALLTDSEMQDILGGIGLPPEEVPAAPPRPEFSGNLEMVLDISLTAVARLGGIEMPLGEILSLGPGSIIEVGHLVDEPVELLVNGRLIARGEVVVVDEKFGLRITEIVSPRMRIESLR